MKAYLEKAIREKMGPEVNKLLDLWGALCNEKIGFSVEVLIADRHDINQLKSFKGELNTARPKKINGDYKLIVYMDSLQNVTPVIFSHELGHWIIKFKGFKGVIFKDATHSNAEILLNSLTHHKPVYVLQKSLGIDPQEEIDSRTVHNIQLFGNDNEPSDSSRQLSNALLVADDLLSCTKKYHDELKNIIKDKHKQTYGHLETILDVESYYDLNDPEKNHKFQRMVIQKLKLSNDWFSPDEVGAFLKNQDITN